MTAAFTIRLDDATLTKLDDLARRTDRSRNWIVNQALQDFLDYEGWVDAKIEEGIAAADRGDFASDEELQRIINKHGPPE